METLFNIESCSVTALTAKTIMLSRLHLPTLVSCCSSCIHCFAYSLSIFLTPWQKAYSCCQPSLLTSCIDSLSTSSPVLYDWYHHKDLIVLPTTGCPITVKRINKPLLNHFCVPAASQSGPMSPCTTDKHLYVASHFVSNFICGALESYSLDASMHHAS